MSKDDERINVLIKEYKLIQNNEDGWFCDDLNKKNKSNGIKDYGTTFFLLKKDEIDHFHILDFDEIWYFHEGCGLKVHIIEPDGTYKMLLFGNDVSKGETPSIIFKKGVMFGAENISCESYTFFSCATIPIFSIDGFHPVTLDEKHKDSPLAKFYTLPKN